MAAIFAPLRLTIDVRLQPIFEIQYLQLCVHGHDHSRFIVETATYRSNDNLGVGWKRLFQLLIECMLYFHNEFIYADLCVFLFVSYYSLPFRDLQHCKP